MKSNGWALVGAMGLLAGCAMTGSKQGPWIGQPVAALDNHSYLKTLPMLRTYTVAGVEVRNYQSRGNTYQCYAERNVVAGVALSSDTYKQTVACTGGSSGCDYVFSIKDGKVSDHETSARIFDSSSCAANLAIGRP